jgi:flagellar protein FlaG
MPEQWVRPDLNIKDSRVIQPVGKSEGGVSKKVGEDKKESQNNAGMQPRDPEQVKSLVEDIEEYLADLKINLNFTIEEDTKDLVVKVIDGQSGEVIRQIPPEELKDLREKLKELRGVLFEEKV